MSFCAVGWCSVCLFLFPGCSQRGVEFGGNDPGRTATASPDAQRKTPPRRIDARHLPNPIQVHPKVISGGLPDGEKAFKELQSLGVKTVISVDGMKPDVETAKKYGLRYVHLPHGYDGVPDGRVKELAKAVREFEGTIYIHCHHGKHRSPAAASVACVAAGLIPPSESVAILKLAGTSHHYRGLYESASVVTPLESALLDELSVDFPESVEVPPMAEAMVAMGHTHDHLKLIAEAGWRSPPDHPDLHPAHQALLMREHFTELLRSEEVLGEPDAFRQSLRDSEQAAEALEVALRAWAATSPAADAPPPESVQRHAAAISANCKACHRQFRDVPLSEK
ncbi:protein-tyrosine phosphatase family protein [Stieleria neptunia]|uniref:cytochrome c n=1 Tax=Stieleria neptunia TaxID=2527979 RepID=UPI0018D26253|nr:cytochrome c [Stieleria neptunia]